MASPEQRAANRANAQRSTGPKTAEGKRSASMNSTRHALSVPVSESLFAPQIQAIVRVIRADCDTDAQASELARRILDFERNEAHWTQVAVKDALDSEGDQAREPQEDGAVVQLSNLLERHKNNLPVQTTFTTQSTKLTRKERGEEKRFISDFLSLQRRSAELAVKVAKSNDEAMVRYQKRATNKLLKGLSAVAAGRAI